MPGAGIGRGEALWGRSLPAKIVLRRRSAGGFLNRRQKSSRRFILSRRKVLSSGEKRHSRTCREEDEPAEERTRENTMIVYDGLKTDFLHSVENDTIALEIEKNIFEKMGRHTVANEFISWDNSMQYM